MGVSFLLFVMSLDAPLSNNSFTIFSAGKTRFKGSQVNRFTGKQIDR